MGGLRASGRVELIGGHTDYNEGFVISAAIDSSYWVAASRRNDNKVCMYSAWAGEKHEFSEMYPQFIEVAEAEGNRAAVISFRNANAVEKIHYDLYSSALESLLAGNDLPAAPIYVCEICGNTVVGAAPDKCSVCGAQKPKFSEVA